MSISTFSRDDVTRLQRAADRVGELAKKLGTLAGAIKEEAGPLNIPVLTKAADALYTAVGEELVKTTNSQVATIEKGISSLNKTLDAMEAQEVF